MKFQSLENKLGGNLSGSRLETGLTVCWWLQPLLLPIKSQHLELQKLYLWGILSFFLKNLRTGDSETWTWLLRPRFSCTLCCCGSPPPPPPPCTFDSSRAAAAVVDPRALRWTKLDKPTNFLAAWLTLSTIFETPTSLDSSLKRNKRWEI